MRIVSMQKGASVVEIFNRFSAATKGIQEVLKKEGYDFMHNDHLGWVLTCPSNLGTGLRWVYQVFFYQYFTFNFHLNFYIFNQI